MSKFLYPIYKLKTKSYIKWWLYHKKAGGSGILSEILEGFSFNLENTLNRKFKLFEIEGNSVQDGTPSPDNEVPIYSAGDNENFLPYPYIAETKTMNGVTFKVNKDGTVIANGTATANAYFMLKGDIDLNGTYTISTGLGISDTKYMALLDQYAGYADKMTTRINNATATVNSRFQAYIYVTSGTTVDNLVFKPKIEKGNKATPYSPYGMGSINEKIKNADGTEEQTYSIEVQQPMRSIGDVRDGFVKKSDGWYERHYIARKIFDGTENLIYLDNHGNYYRYYILNFQNGTGIRPVLSNYFIDRGNQAFGEYNFIQLTGNDFYLQIENITTLADLKTWLSEQYANGNPVYVDYLLAEPLDLPCTEEQIEALENKPSTYKDFTIIQSEDETPAHLKIQYYKEG